MPPTKKQQFNMRPILSGEQVVELQETIKESIHGALIVDTPFKIGHKYLVRTVTMVNIGMVKQITRDFITLSNASWIPDTGRWSECLKSPTAFNAIEPFLNDAIIGINTIVDATEWPFSLPTEAK